MSEFNLRPENYNFCDPKELERYLMTGQAELLDFLNRIEIDFAQVTELYTKFSIIDTDPNILVKLDSVTHQYISALTALHVFYQQLLSMRNIETPVYYADHFYPDKSKD